MTSGEPSRALLVSMLKEAAKLEHCLLTSYIYTACTAKSTPQEFLTDAASNRRRGVQFERVRRWKESLLQVAVEEMRHLHLVQCLLRALGERPCFEFPDRNKQGVWTIPNWRMRLAGVSGPPVEVPLQDLSSATIRQFILYEASDSLQDSGPFSPENQALFHELSAFEDDLYSEGVLFTIDDEKLRQEMKDKLGNVFRNLAPDQERQEVEAEAVASIWREPAENVRFASISDFYLEGILPLYQQAFDFGWTKYNNLDLANELHESLPQESLLPIGPVYRSIRFKRFTSGVDTNPLRNFKRVSDVIHEIVDEGEGFEKFARRARSVLAAIKQNGGARKYIELMLADQNAKNVKGFKSPSWFNDAQQLRLSHLYRFIMIMRQQEDETLLSQRSGQKFEAARPRVSPLPDGLALSFAQELVEQINACYLVIVAWLSRIYEITNWVQDSSRRIAVEQLATWPLMSLALRPLLEMASLFVLDAPKLLCLEESTLPMLPVHARSLLALYTDPDRSEAINERMDYLAVRILSAIADWAASRIDDVSRFNLPDREKELLLHRLEALNIIRDFQKQFPFRSHGGYSGQLPDLSFQLQHSKDKSRYEEDPRTVQPLFTGAVLRLRFKGWGLVQLATDPDPPTDEAGAVGTHMLHPADGNKRLNRAVLFQDFDPATTIRRGPKDAVPVIGVNCEEASLLIAPSRGVSAGYSPIEPPAAFQAPGDVGPQQGIQYKAGVLRATPLISLLTIPAAELLSGDRRVRMFLRPKAGVPAHLVGNNHLSWQDGEPIDPFILGVYADQEGGESKLLFEREVFNDGKDLLEMSPFQRIFTRREPCGFEFNIKSAIPAWAMTAKERDQVFGRGPVGYLTRRGKALTEALSQLLAASDYSQDAVDRIATFADRAFRVSVPRSTTVLWLTIGLNYGHTVSGEIQNRDPAPILSKLGANLGAAVSLTPAAAKTNRTDANSRWLAVYTKSIMDTDALSDFCWAEIYVPLQVEPVIGTGQRFEQSWDFPLPLADDVTALACDFSHPFWTQAYVIDGERRTLLNEDGTTIVERLHKKWPHGYEYEVSGYKGLSNALAAFTIEKNAQTAKLCWRLNYSAADSATMLAVLRFAAQLTAATGNALSTTFAPRASHS